MNEDIIAYNLPANTASASYRQSMVKGYSYSLTLQNYGDSTLTFRLRQIDAWDFEEKKMIVTSIISTVNVSRDPKLEVDFKMSMERFWGKLETEESVETAKVTI